MALKPTLHKILPLALILLGITATLSTACGIFSMPVTGPKALATNARLLHFTADIVDDAGTPLNGVSVTATRFALDNNLLLGETDQFKKDRARLVDGTLEYNDFGDYAVSITFSKSGYQPFSATYSTTDQVTHAPPFLGPPGNLTENCINIQKNPKQRVVLVRIKPAPGTNDPMPR